MKVMFRFKLCLFFTTLLLINSVLAKSSVWIAEKDGHHIIIAGSIHLIHPSQLPLPQEYLKAFAASDRIVFEIDLQEMKQPASLVKILNTFKLTENTLDKVLKPELWQELKTVMAQHDIPLSMLLYDASFLSFSLPIMILQQQGYQEGIDNLLYTKAQQEKKLIMGLETFDEQLTALASLKNIDPNVLIKEMLNEIRKPQFSLELLIKELYQGKQDILTEQIAMYNKQEMATFIQVLLVNRNKAWIPAINELAKDPQHNTMVVVGAMHLAGNNSVLELLKEHGYTISYYE